MEAQEIIRYIQTASKKTPVKVYLNVTEPIKFKDSKVFGEGNSFVVFGDYESIAPVLEAEAEKSLKSKSKLLQDTVQFLCWISKNQCPYRTRCYYQRSSVHRQQCRDHDGSDYQYRCSNR